MQRKQHPIITGILFGILILSIHLTLTGTWIAADINHCQSTIMVKNQYFPLLTIICFFVPSAMIILFITHFHTLKNKLKRS
jgi:hypothetical protein